MFALVDCNNFYVSCERVFNPALNNKPVVVLSNNDGCAISRSNEAKALGIKMAAPVFFMKDVIKKNNIILLSSNYTLYGDLSHRVNSIYSQYSPEVENYSIDESFLNLSGFPKHKLAGIAQEIREKVFQWTGIPVCVGIAATKTLAKLANRLAKKIPSGVLVLDPNQNHNAALEKVPVGDVWGVGGQYAKWLTAHGVQTARELRDSNEKWIRQRMTVVGERTVLELRGTSCIQMELVAPDKKAICHARSFGKLLTDKEEVREAVSLYAARAAYKVRAGNLIARYINVFLETNPFRETDPQYRNSFTIKLPSPSNLTPEIVHYALIAFEKIWKDGFRYKKTGVMLLELVPDDMRQTDLFDSVDRVKSMRVMTALDAVNQKYGRFSLNYAGGFIKDDWKPAYEKRSPRYTTNWDELPIAMAS